MVIVRVWEGLGNQLFQYAFAKSYALRTGEIVKLDSERIFEQLYTEGNIERPYALNNFHISLPQADSTDLMNYNFLARKNIYQKAIFHLAKYGIWKYAFWEEAFHKQSPKVRCSNSNRYLKGWFQNEKYFSAYRNILLREITPKQKICISHELMRILNSGETVSLHIRRGDFKKNGSVLPIQYYVSAYKWLQGIVPECTYLIFSDDMQWAKGNLGFIKNKYYVNEKRELADYEELMIMSKCHHNIIANSTFSWWGAWLNRHSDKLVIAPKKWFLWRTIDEDVSIIPKAWKRM